MPPRIDSYFGEVRLNNLFNPRFTSKREWGHEKSSLISSYFYLEPECAGEKKMGLLLLPRNKTRMDASRLKPANLNCFTRFTVPWYYNSDVTAELRKIVFEQVDKDRVRVTGVKGMPVSAALSTLKFSSLTHILSRLLPTRSQSLPNGGYQAEAHYFAVRLDVEEKAKMLEIQLRNVLDIDKLHCFKVRTNGRPPLDPSTQDSATCDIRIFCSSSE